MAPPLTLTFSVSQPSPLFTAQAWAAKASMGVAWDGGHRRPAIQRRSHHQTMAQRAGTCGMPSDPTGDTRLEAYRKDGSKDCKPPQGEPNYGSAIDRPGLLRGRWVKLFCAGIGGN